MLNEILITLSLSFYFQNKNINELEKGRNSCMDIEYLVQKKPIAPAEVSTGMLNLAIGSTKCARNKIKLQYILKE